MHEVFIINGFDIFKEILAFCGFILGYAIKGYIARLIQDKVITKIVNKAASWEHTHPIRWAKWNHYFDQHTGNYYKCPVCNPTVSGVAAQS